MKFIQSAAVIALLLNVELTSAIQINKTDSKGLNLAQVDKQHLPVDKSLISDKQETILFGQEKENFLQEKIDKGLKQVDEIQKSLIQAKVELETDRTMLLRHKKEMEEETHLISQLNQRVDVRAQTVDKLEDKKKKREHLQEQAKRLAKNEGKIREKVQQQLKERINKEAEDARKQGLIEAKSDPQMLEHMRLASLKKAEEDQMMDENKEIEKLSEANERKHKKTLAEVYKQKYPEDHVKNLSQKKENPEELKNTDGSGQNRAAFNAGQQYGAGKDNAFKDHTINTNGAGRILAETSKDLKIKEHGAKQGKMIVNMLPQQKNKVKDDEIKQITSGIKQTEQEVESSDDEEDEEPEVVKAGPIILDHPVEAEEEPKPIVHHMTKQERDGYYSSNELLNFSKEEDQAIKQQLNGEELIRTTGPTLIKEINGEVKNATPNWVSGKWVRNMKTAARNAKKRADHKKLKLAQHHKK